ncbi:MAG: YceI family protein [Saprospiraceae bacterium]|nr:YceI family protein [Saprospiraceae bacterium]
MKYKLLILAICSVSFVFGQSNYRVSNYSLVVKGTSNLHEWESTAKEVRANGNFTFTAGTLKSIDALYVEIPVKSIKSTKGSIMDNKTYDALKADKFPNIGFKLGKINSLVKKGDGYDINASGSLTIAGSSAYIDLYVKGKTGADGSITFSGSKKLKMTDYNIKPPTALLGTLTTGDEVEIVFQVSLKGAAPVSQ